jgi:hypothetical protein
MNYTLCIEGKPDRKFLTLDQAESTIYKELGSVDKINDYLIRGKHTRRSYVCKKGKAMVMIEVS